MNELLPEQIEALAELQQTAKDRAVEVVLIGAAACRAWVKDNTA
jgi:hypothetical protein